MFSLSYRILKNYNLYYEMYMWNDNLHPQLHLLKKNIKVNVWVFTSFFIIFILITKEHLEPQNNKIIIHNS